MAQKIKNTDGVYTADPRACPEAFPIATLKYDEAMELAYFGAQVLHPSAMVPCIENNIPVYVRNIFNPAFAGTVISGRSRTLRESLSEGGAVKNWRSKSGEIPIKGITSVDKTALVTLEGASALGCANTAERCMGALADAGINVLIITQASSESSITMAVPESEGKSALLALQNAFELELSRSTIGSLSLATGMSIVAIVGEGMALTSGVSSTFMSSLARANVNIRCVLCSVLALPFILWLVAVFLMIVPLWFFSALLRKGPVKDKLRLS
jgi:bifunctional aspartokinase / homoserine dehydrogenase 1